MHDVLETPTTRRHLLVPTVVTAPLLLLAVACGGDAPGTAEWSGSVADSAGVAVVTNPAEGLWPEEGGWTVREVLAIGGLDAPPAEQFGQVTGIEVGPDGALYVLDQQASELRVFSTDGEHLGTIGEPGQGPGQLGRALAGPFAVGGDILVPDLQNQRVSRYSTEGESLGSFRLDFTAGVPIRWDGPLDGRLLAQRRVVTMPGDEPEVPGGDPVVAVDLDGAVADTLLVLPRGQSLDMSRDGPSLRFFAPEPIWDAGPDGRLVSGMNASFRIEVRSPEGRLERIVTLPRQRRPVTERDRDVMLDAMRELSLSQGAPPQAVDMMLSRATFAESYPLFASLLVGPDGTLWAQQLRTGDELAGGAEGTFDAQDLGSPVWDVFDAEGRYLGEVTFPGRFQPLRVDGDRIWGVARDELDVQSVKGFEVVRPG